MHSLGWGVVSKRHFGQSTRLASEYVFQVLDIRFETKPSRTRNNSVFPHGFALNPIKLPEFHVELDLFSNFQLDLGKAFEQAHLAFHHVDFNG